LETFVVGYLGDIDGVTYECESSLLSKVLQFFQPSYASVEAGDWMGYGGISKIAPPCFIAPTSKNSPVEEKRNCHPPL
jgi:hypothetical protein